MVASQFQTLIAEGIGHEHRQEREDRREHGRLAVGEHVVAPDEEADDRDGDGGKRDEAIAEDVLAGESGDDFGHDAHRGKDHDVHGGVGVEPEEMLEENRIAAVGRIKDAGVKDAFHDEQQKRDAEDGGGQHLDESGGVRGPEEERHAEPGHAGRAGVCGW